MRWVLDTNVVASAFLWDGVPRQVLKAARDRHIELFTSTPLLAELTDILGRQKFKQKIAASGFTVDQLVDRYTALAAVVRPIPISGVARDPDDDVVIGTALAAQADIIVTGDKDLLVLHPYQGVDILNASGILKALTSK